MIVDDKVRSILREAAARLDVNVELLFDWARSLRADDEIHCGFIENLRTGDFEIVSYVDGEPHFRLTEQGAIRTKELLRENPEARRFFNELRGH